MCFKISGSDVDFWSQFTSRDVGPVDDDILIAKLRPGQVSVSWLARMFILFSGLLKFVIILSCKYLCYAMQWTEWFCLSTLSDNMFALCLWFDSLEKFNPVRSSRVHIVGFQWTPSWYSRFRFYFRNDLLLVSLSILYYVIVCTREIPTFTPYFFMETYDSC